MPQREKRLAGWAIVVSGLAYACIAANVFAGPLEYLPQVLLTGAVTVIIAVGADWLVAASCRIAKYLGVSHLVIGLTVVAFGTSAPEMVASLGAGLKGNGDIAVANVVGSNIFNICFILGGIALLVRGGLVTDRQLVWRDGPILLLGTVLLFFFVGGEPGTSGAAANRAVQPDAGGDSFWPELLNLKLERVEGILLMCGLVAYLVHLYRTRRSVAASAPRQPVQQNRPGPGSENSQQVIAAEEPGGDEFGEPSWHDVPLFLIGLFSVLMGCHILVGRVEVSGNGAVEGYGALWFAVKWGVPDYVVGVTIVAAGTSAPEFMVSLVAALRGAFSLSAGNLIGSDIFNMFGVVGLAGMLLQQPLAVPVMLSPAVIPSLMALCLLIAVAIFFMRTGMRISRAEGLALVLIGAARWTMDFALQGQM